MRERVCEYNSSLIIHVVSSVDVLMKPHLNLTRCKSSWMVCYQMDHKKRFDELHWCPSLTQMNKRCAVGCIIFYVYSIEDYTKLVHQVSCCCTYSMLQNQVAGYATF